MDYTMTVWIDFVAETREEAVEITDELRDQVRRTVRVFQPATVTAIEFEWTPADPAHRTLAPSPFAEQPLQP